MCVAGVALLLASAVISAVTNHYNAARYMALIGIVVMVVALFDFHTLPQRMTRQRREKNERAKLRAAMKTPGGKGPSPLVQPPPIG